MTMTTAKLIAALQAAPQPEIDRITPDAAKLIALLRGETAIVPQRSGVTYLRYGQTKRAEGYDSEAEYLAAVRRPTPMRTNPKGRYTYLRFDHRPNLGYRSHAAEHQRATAKLAELFQPNIILGS